MKSTACWTVVIFSASSSGISVSNSSSRAITSSTVSSESAPRSSTNDDSFLISPSLTPNCSAMILRTLCSTFSIIAPSEGVRILRHVHAAVDVQDRSRHVTGGRRGQVGYRRGHVLRRAQPPERDVLEQRLFLLLGKRARHVRIDKARGHAVDRDVAAAELGGERLGHADHPGLGGR